MGARHRTKSNQVWTIQRSRQHWEQDTERRGNQVWTMQRRRQHWEQDTERRAIKYGQSRDIDNIGSKTQNEEQSSMDNPETKKTLAARHRTKGNQVWTIQRRRQHLEQNTERRAIKYGQSRDIDNIGSKTQNEEQSSMDNP